MIMRFYNLDASFYRDFNQMVMKSWINVKHLLVTIQSNVMLSFPSIRVITKSPIHRALHSFQLHEHFKTSLHCLLSAAEEERREDF